MRQESKKETGQDSRRSFSGKYSSATFVYKNGIPCYIDAQHAIAHNKVMVIDVVTVITGSFNFTKAAEANNAENLLVIHTEMAAKYAQNWSAHREHSEPYTGIVASGETSKSHNGIR